MIPYGIEWINNKTDCDVDAAAAHAAAPAAAHAATASIEGRNRSEGGNRIKHNEKDAIGKMTRTTSFGLMCCGRSCS